MVRGGFTHPVFHLEVILMRRFFSILVFVVHSGWAQELDNPNKLKLCDNNIRGPLKHNCWGTFSSADGSHYVGEWKDGLYDGQGTLRYPNGDRYLGAFKNSQPNGRGTLIYANGDKHVGKFKDGAPELDNPNKLALCPKNNNAHLHNCWGSLGQIGVALGFSYVGEWLNNQPNGQGTGVNGDGNKYVGAWRDGRYHGKGVLTYANGNKYVGEFKNGLRHGKGAHRFASGDEYVGEWAEGKYHGYGVLTFKDGRLAGVWEQGNLVREAKDNGGSR